MSVDVGGGPRMTRAKWIAAAGSFILDEMVGRRRSAGIIAVMAAMNTATVATAAGCMSTAAGELLVSNEDFLTESDVSELPAGDAMGSAFTGFYRLRSFGVVDRYCARGNVNEVFGALEPGVAGFAFAHVDGRASMLGWDQIPIAEPVYAGGVDADGDFGLGAVDEITTADDVVVGETLYRVDGDIDELGHLESTWRQRVRFALGGDEVDCEAVAIVDADFEPGAEGDPCTLDADCPAFAPHCDGAACYDGSVGDPCANETDCVGTSVCDGVPASCR